MAEECVVLALTKMEYDTLVKIVGAANYDPTLPLHCPDNPDFVTTFTSEERSASYRIYKKIMANSLNA